MAIHFRFFKTIDGFSWIVRLAVFAVSLTATISPIQAQTPATTTPATTTPAATTPAATTPATTTPAPKPAPAAAPEKPAPAVVEDCVADNAFRKKDNTLYYPVGDRIISTTYFLPSNTSTDLGWKIPYNKDATYFGKVETYNQVFGGKNSVTASKIPEDHPMVKKGLADKSDTLVSLRVSPNNAGFWTPGTVFLYTCDSTDAKKVSVLNMRVSSSFWSTIVAWISVMVLYLFAALTSAAIDTKTVGFWRRANPVFITAGSDGRGSLAKLQILFFSMIVFGLLLFIVLRTGVLSDLSTTVLTLLGIAAIGSTAAKATDVQRNRIDFDNWTWFIGKNWLPAGGLAEINRAKWRDIVTSDGEFDVYRYQSCIFSLVVGGALLAAGINQLASFSIPDTLLAVLGLSQVVYVAGKLVTPPSFAELNKSTSDLRALEKEFGKAVSAASPANRPVNIAAASALAKPQYDAYKSAANNVRIGFETITGRAVAPADVEPSY
jgi:hypothetical protein